MFDPLTIFIVLFGGLLVGLFEGVARRRNRLAIVINVVVGGLLGVCASFVCEPTGLAISRLFPAVDRTVVFPVLLDLMLNIVPIVGGLFGVIVLLKLLRREHVSRFGKIIGGITMVVFPIAVLSHFAHAHEVKTRQYVRLSSYTPIKLDGWEITGKENVTLALTSGLAKEGVIVTPPASKIVDGTPLASVGRKYRLRIVNGTGSDFGWTLTAGSRVTLIGSMTIPPSTWRDFEVTLVTLDDVLIESKATGNCDFQNDLRGCQPDLNYFGALFTSVSRAD